jgi:hypothetical protein
LYENYISNRWSNLHRDWSIGIFVIDKTVFGCKKYTKKWRRNDSNARYPQASDVELIYSLSVLMIFEFVLVHSGVFMNIFCLAWKFLLYFTDCLHWHLGKKMKQKKIILTTNN